MKALTASILALLCSMSPGCRLTPYASAAPDRQDRHETIPNRTAPQKTGPETSGTALLKADI